jgi:hypothetical protein
MEIKWRTLQNMFTYPYKIQVRIIVESMILYNYIRKMLQDDVVFAKYDCNSNFAFDNFLPDVVVHLNRRGLHIRILYANGIANSLMEQ